MNGGRFLKAYRYFEIPFPIYLVKVYFPLTLMVVASYFLIFFIAGKYLGSFFLGLFAILFALLDFVILIYPYLKYVRIGKLIDRDMHLFITRLGILSLTYVSRKDLFNILSEIKEYRELAHEIKKIHTLITKWNIDLADACRIVAEITPSEQLADFLTRMAHAVESGETAESFSQNEQRAAMEEYSIRYENSINSIGILNEIYLASISAALFFITVAAILPMLMGGDYTPFYLSIVLFAVIEFGVFYYIYVSVPWEQVWETSAITTDIKIKLRRMLWLGGTLCIPFAIIAFFLPIPYEIKVAFTLTPLIIPGYYATKTEALIKKREEFYPAFIRSLGTSASGVGKETTFALKKLRFYKFGPLTDNINDLYKRLSLRVDKRQSWKIFGAETGSDLISKFNDLYVDGTDVGGDPRKISTIISENFLKILSLRKKRFLAASTTSGLLYGSTVFVSFPLYVLVWVIAFMNNMFMEIAPVAEEYSFLSLFYGGMIGIEALRILMFSMVMAHVFIASGIKKVLSASNTPKVLFDMVIMMWIGSLTAVVTSFVMSLLL